METMKKISAVLPLLALALLPAKAHAISVSAEGGLSFLGGDASIGYSSSAPRLGGSIDFDLAPMISVGAFYDATLASTDPWGVGATKSFYGALIRFDLPILFFGEARAGLTKQSYTTYSSDAAFGFGISAGYKMLDLGVVQLSPMLGFRSLPTQIGSNQSLGGTTLDLGIRLSVGI